MSTVTKIIKQETIKRLWFIALGFVFVELGAALSLLSPLLTRTVIDEIIPHADLQRLLQIAGLYFLVFVGSQLTGILQSYIFTAVSHRIIISVRSKILVSALSNFRGSARRIDPGDALTRLTSDLPEAASFITTIIVEAIDRFSMLIIASTILFTMDVRLALIIIAGIPFMIITNELFLKKNKAYAKELKSVQSNLANSVTESWHFRQQLFFYRAFTYSLGRVNKDQESLYQKNISYFKFQSLTGLLQSFIGFLPPFLVLFLGAQWVIGGTLTIGSIVAVMSYMGRIYSPIQSIASFRNRYQSYRVAIDRLEVLSGVSDNNKSIITENRKSGSELQETQGTGIQINNMSFTYRDPESTTQVFKDISFTIRDNGIYRIKGDNGAGKSTLIALLLGALEPESGKILVNGKTPHAMTDEEVRRTICVVPQHDAVFTDTLCNNIQLGIYEKPIARNDDLVTAELWRDSHTKITDSEMISFNALSGGQRKLIALKRAALSKATIVILDEPFGPLDYKSRNILIKWVEKQAQNRIIIIIDHGKVIENSKLADKLITIELSSQ